ADYRISNLYGEDRPPTEEDVRMLLQYLVGYRIEDLTYREIDVGMPTIEVVSEIPSGGLTALWIDIEYVATPSEGAYIREVWYTRKGYTDYVYLSETHRNGPRGTLGQARVSLRTEDIERKLTFHVEDSAGLTATYEIEAMPYHIDLSYEIFDLPEREYAFSDTRGIRYVTNRLHFFSVYHADPGDIDMDAIAQAFVSVGGEIERVDSYDTFTIYISPTDEDGLNAKGEYLLENYPHLFKRYSIEYLLGIVSGNTAPEGGGFFNSSVTTGSSFRTNDDMWDRGYDWAFHTIGLPWAWSVFGAHVRQEPKIGIIDDGVNHEHESLHLLPSNMFVYSTRNHGDGSHGTLVMSIIAALHNIKGIMVGAINIEREAVYSYNSYLPDGDSGQHTDLGILAGLRELVRRKDVRIINVSLGGKEPIDPFTTTESGQQIPSYPNFNERMNEMIAEGKNFLVITSAGNDAIEARYKGSFSLVTEPLLRARIITVGNSTEDGDMADSSNYGIYVDVVAPGTDIYASLPRGNVGVRSGTSLSAPYVSGLAALIWAEKPELTPEQVRNIIIGSARSHGRAIVDNRTNIPESFQGLTYYEINVPAALFMARGIDPSLYLGDPRGRFTTPRTAVLVGHVIDHEGNAVKNARVRLYNGSTVVFEERTNDYGFYRMFDVTPIELRPSNLHMQIDTLTHAPYTLENMTVNAGINEYTHELKHAMPVTITLMNATTSTPIANRTITLSHRHNSESWTSKTDGRGQAEFHVSMVAPPVVTRTYNLTIDAPDVTNTSAGIVTLTAPWATPTSTPSRKSVTIYDITDEFVRENIRTRVLSNLGKRSNDRIYEHEVAEMKLIHFCSGLGIQDMQELSALKYFTSLEFLCLSGNNLTEIDASIVPSLTTLYAWSNYYLTSVNITKNVHLRSLDFWRCSLTSLDVSNNKNLSYLELRFNYMQSIDDVIGWRNTRLTEDGSTIYFDPQSSRVQSQGQSQGQSEPPTHSPDFDPCPNFPIQ
ncbi:MAG: S8 family serine peptidase, partial [Defluviitaleaceae bacterium]|nr:S8 family serine peptidase [Defluviitaleaceae bacterium]